MLHLQIAWTYARSISIIAFIEQYKNKRLQIQILKPINSTLKLQLMKFKFSHEKSKYNTLNHISRITTNDINNR